jgi:F-type H+-transporting ATPase subunit epsilon
VLGGLAEVSDKGLTVLADVATSIQDLDRRQFAERLPKWKPSSPRRKAPNSTTPSSGCDHFKSIQQRAQRHGYALSPGHRSGARQET